MARRNKMTDTTTDPTNGATPPSVGDPTDDTGVKNEIAQMNAAFQFAMKAQMEITKAKTIDDAELDTAKQRPQ
jgi:hypothetical protein